MNRAIKDEVQACMVRLAEGHREAFQPLYQALWPIIRRFAEHALHGSPDAEDAAQLALMNIFSRVSEFDRERDALTWALGVTAYQCRTLRQKTRRRREASSIDGDRANDAASPEEVIVAQDLDAALHEVIGLLRPTDVETLRAMMNDDRPPIPGATFRKRVERALERLRAAWSSRHGLD